MYNALTAVTNDRRSMIDTPRYWRACWRNSRDARRRWLTPGSTDPARHSAACSCRRAMREEAARYAAARGWRIGGGR